MTDINDFDKNIVKDGINKATADFTQRIESSGFHRTKKWFWVREHEYSADFIHIHVSGSSYGGPINYSVGFRVHCGNRSFGDSFEALALNGPNSDDPDTFSRRYHLRFNAKSGSTYERCIDDLVRFVRDEGEAWFKAQNKSHSGQVSDNEAYSRKLLGLKRA